MNSLRLRPFCVAASLLLVAACTPTPDDPCEEVACGEGTCEVSAGAAACRCNDGFHAQALKCVADEKPVVDPCDPNPCVEANRGQCIVSNAAARCVCNSGYVELNGACVVDDPCDRHTCSEANRGVCTVVGGVPECGCDEGYELEAGGCKQIVMTCASFHEDGDAFEPDECAVMALDVGTQGVTAQGHTLQPAGDQDWYKLTVTAATVYRFVASGAPSTVNAKLFAQDGTTELASVSASAPEIFMRAAANGTFYYRVRFISPTATGSYSATIENIGTDDHGDNAATATAVSASATPIDATFERNADVDYFSFNVVGARIHSVRCDASPGTCAVKVYNEAGNPIELGGTPDEEWIRKLESGRYFVAVRPTGATTGAYRLTVQDLGPDDHAEANAAATAMTGATANGTIGYQGDVDVLSFQGTATHIYWISCTRDVDLSNCYTTLRDGADAVLAASTTGGDAMMRWEIAADGTYFIRVSSDVYDVGGYTITVNDLGPDDHGDTFTTATMASLTAGNQSSGSGIFELRDDYDYFSVALPADKIFQVRCTPVGASSCPITLKNASDATLAQDINGPDYVISYKTLAADTYFLRFGSNFNGSAGTYTWTLEEQTDDHGNTPATATDVTFTGGSVGGTAQTEISQDADVFAFPATANTIYRISCAGSASLDCNISVRNVDDATLARDGAPGAALVYFQAPASTTYYARFSLQTGQLGSYTWQIEETALVDDHDDTTATTSTLTPDGTQVQGILTQGDVDFFAVTLPASSNYKVTFSGSAQQLNVTVFGTDGTTQLTTSNTSPRNFSTSGAGTYFIRLQSNQTEFSTGQRSGSGTFQVAVAPQ